MTLGQRGRSRILRDHQETLKPVGGKVCRKGTSRLQEQGEDEGGKQTIRIWQSFPISSF